MVTYISPISNESLTSLCEHLKKKNPINANDFERYAVKRGLRNADGTGVMAGITRICSVEGYFVSDGERIPTPGRLIYRGIDVCEITENCMADDRFGFEEVAWLLLFGSLPTKVQLDSFAQVLAQSRQLPQDFVENMILKSPSQNIMNKMERSILSLYSYDENPEDLSAENVLRQSIQLIAQLPTIMSYAYQVKRRYYDKESMYIHQVDESYGTAQSILNFLREDRKFTDKEAKLLDICLILHAEHGGGNNSTFVTRALTSSGTDTYSAIAGGVGSLKGHRHGGANIKVTQMVDNIKANVDNITNEGEVADYLKKIIKKQANDNTGLVYGMGHAVYTISDPRAVLLKEKAKEFSKGTDFEEEYRLLELIESFTPILLQEEKGDKKRICANVDLYSGLVYKLLNIPEEIFTPLFAAARVVGWSAHRIEELTTVSRIMRPAYKSVSLPHKYIPLDKRTVEADMTQPYIPIEERI
ncbi:MAG: citrate synthase [Clostridia bacterium]|nr:citrate synthase [Clostridia bacterium]